MKRQPPSPRLALLSLPLLIAALLAAPAVSTQAIDQRSDPANANYRRIDDPRFQRRMTQSAQSVAESLVGRSANATDQQILGQFTEQQTQLLRQLQNAFDAMPSSGAGANYSNPGRGGNGGLDQRAIDELLSTPEGRYVLEEITRGGKPIANPPPQNRAPQRRAYPQSYPQPAYPQQSYPQQGYPQQQGNAYPQNNAYPGDADPYGGSPQSGYSQGDYGQSGYPQGAGMSTGQALGLSVVQDIANAAILRATQPKIIYRQAPPPRP